MPMYGQLVIGAPGAGKTSYCHGVSQLLKALNRKHVIINLDPANEQIPYDCAIDIRKLVSVDDVMDLLKLGPNGAMIYCMEYLENNMAWLVDLLHQHSDCYLLFDCPGQIELYVHNSSIQNIVSHLTDPRNLDMRLTAVNLVDSHHCADPGKYISVLLTSLSAMLHIGLPHINVLSKIDVAEKYGSLSFGIDFYTEVLDLSYLVDQLKDDRFLTKYARLNEAIIGTIQDYNLVTFHPLSIEDKELVISVLAACDRANGFSLSEDSATVASLLSSSLYKGE